MVQYEDTGMEYSRSDIWIRKDSDDDQPAPADVDD